MFLLYRKTNDMTRILFIINMLNDILFLLTSSTISTLVQYALLCMIFYHYTYKIPSMNIALIVRKVIR